MTQDPVPHTPRDSGAAGLHRASLRVRLGPASLKARTEISTRGLVAVTGLVVGTLLSVAAVVAVSTRKLPEGTLPRHMRRSRG